ncbi:MAG TPA: zinc-dependent peptidase [Bacteroidia bacterium]|nr:zinc-dependent peptidase [Bacteroidia bacterium]HNU33144.1 zinc-dependent peptidase [Bacteroidia bacterium]
MLDWQQYFGLFLCGVVVLGFFIFLNYAINRVLEFFRYFSIKPFDKNELGNFLDKHFPYYQNLSDAGREKFIKRVKWFKENKLFYGKEDLILSNEMIVHVSACFAQLTFGLKDYRLSSYKKIFLYPDIFYSGLLKADVKGLTFKHTAIHLSWKNFKEGYDNPDDKINLGLHELAHALKFDLEDELGFDSHFANYIDDWQRISEKEYNELANEVPSFLRSYGGANREEFFAVCVEHFFEAPEAFEDELPDIYNHLCFLLQQNPQNTTSDYLLTPTFLEKIKANEELIPLKPKTRIHHLRESFYGLSLLMFVSGLVIGVPVYLYYSEMLLMENGFFKAVAIPVFIFGLLQSVFFKIRGFNNMGYFVAYNFIGFVFLTLSLFVIVNYSIREKKTATRLHKIRLIDLEVVEGRGTGKYILTLEKNELVNYIDVRTFSKSEVGDITHSQMENSEIFMVLHLSKGFWGIDNVLSKRLIQIGANNSYR